MVVIGPIHKCYNTQYNTIFDQNSQKLDPHKEQAQFLTPWRLSQKYIALDKSIC